MRRRSFVATGLSLFAVFVSLLNPSPVKAQASGLVAGYAFSEASGTTTADASGNNNTGTLNGATRTTAGKFGSALVFNGTSAFVDLGNPATLQLTGSLTLSAWIKTAAFPVDDATIVSKRTGTRVGFQLDTSVDTGPRTIGFKLTNASGGLMARYGATALQVNQWYHVTGVYDAAARTLNVYLNGQLNNGTLLGTVTATQQNSTLNVNIGRRPGLSGFAFNGTIDEVRIYNRALTQAQIQADMVTPVGGTLPPSDTTPPTAPTALSATVVSTSRIDLSWVNSTDAVGVTGYQVDRCQGTGCANFAQIATSTTTSFSDTGKVANTSYSYRVRATDAAGNLSAYSSVVSATTQAIVDTQVPTAPTNLAATAASSAQINLTWTASTDNVAVSGHLVERCQGAACTSFAQVATAVGTSFSDTGRLASTSYSYRVRATDAAGNLSAYSGVASAATQGVVDAQAPTAPGTLTATATSGNQVDLNWTASTDNIGVTAYRVEQCQGAGCANFTEIATVNTTTSIVGPLSVSANPNYFKDASGNTLALNGSHTWNSLQDWGSNGSTQTFDFTAFVNFLVAHGHNFTLLWRTEMPKFCGLPTNASSPPDFTVGPHPWQRTGPGNATDGALRFDLTKFDQGYFDRLRARVQALNDAGVYAGVYLFSGEWLNVFRCASDGYPFTGSNNINGIDDGYTGGNNGVGSMAMTAPNAITALQDAYVQKTIDTLNDLPNVLWIVSEEAPPSSTWWNDHHIAQIRSYESGKPFRHPIGYAEVLGLSDSVIYNSDADWVLPAARISPATSCGSGTPTCKVNVNDSDHSYFGAIWIESAQQNRAYAWTNFTTGNQVVFMDPYVVFYPRDNRNLCLSPTNAICAAPDARWDNFRDNLGYITRYSRRLNLANVTSRSSLCSTSNCLAQTPPVGAEYLIYALSGGSFSVDLSAMASSRSLNVEWFNPSTGTTTVASPIPAGSPSQSFTAPFSGDAVLYLVDSAGHAASVALPTSYKVTGVAAGTSSYRVRATDASGNLSAYSNVASATTLTGSDTIPPAAATGLTATAASASQINLVWTAATDNVAVTGYRVERCQGAGCTVFAQIATPATTSFNDTGLTAGASYSYQVRAADAAGNLSAYSNVASATTSSTPSGLMAAYSFNEGAGTTVTDASGNNNTGTLNGATRTTAGKFGSALVFNGTSAFVDLGNPATLQLTGSLTLSAWIKTAAFPVDDATIVSKRTGTRVGFQLDTSVDTGPRTIGFKLTNASGGLMARYGATALQVNQWYHVTGVYDAAARTLNVYLNGQLNNGTLLGTVTATQQNSTLNVNIGRRPGLSGFAFNGTIDEVRIYNRALSLAEIQADMATSIGNAGSFPAATLSSSSISFPDQGTGTTSSAQAVTMSNTGGATLLISGIAISGSHSFDYSQVNDCGSSLAPSGSCTINVVFTPSATGTRTATVVISDNAPGSPHTIALTGTGVASTGLSVSPRAVALTFARTQQFTTNSGGVTWLVDGIPGGSGALGTVTPAGLYTPPSTAGVHTVTASASGQSANATVYVTNNPGVFTHHNDNFRTGQNLSETVLTPANVTAAKFGKLFSYPLDGIAYASPLYVANVNIPGQGFHNVVYVATEHDSVYAFDADGLSSNPLWHVSFIDPAAGVTPVPSGDTAECCDIAPEIGITGTPVIDSATGTLYVVAKTKEVAGATTNYVQRLHALDIATGAEKFGGPVVIQANVPGNGLGAVGGRISFDPLGTNQRPALLLSNGVVYIGFGSHGNPNVYHGWVLGYDPATLQQVMAFNTTPDARAGGVWQAGGGPAVDADGNMYFATGNGTFDASAGGADYGDSVVKLSPAGVVLDYFSPHDQETLDAQDIDLGSAGVLLLPDQNGPNPRLLIAAGKAGTIFLCSRDDLGHFNLNGDTQIVQVLPNALPGGTVETGNRMNPVYYNGRVYFSAVADNIKAFQLNNGLLSLAPTSQSVDVYNYPGGPLAISANGSAGAILWTVQRFGLDPSGGGTVAPGVLHAYDPANLGNEFYNSNQAGARDTLDFAAKFSVPLVVNGKVFVSSESQVTVYGLLP